MKIAAGKTVVGEPLKFQPGTWSQPWPKPGWELWWCVDGVPVQKIDPEEPETKNYKYRSQDLGKMFTIAEIREKKL